MSVRVKGAQSQRKIKVNKSIYCYLKDTRDVNFKQEIKQKRKINKGSVCLREEIWQKKIQKMSVDKRPEIHEF